jgi:hypothetical protein
MKTIEITDESENIQINFSDNDKPLVGHMLSGSQLLDAISLYVNTLYEMGVSVTTNNKDSK